MAELKKPLIIRANGRVGTASSDEQLNALTNFSLYFISVNRSILIPDAQVMVTSHLELDGCLELDGSLEFL